MLIWKPNIASKIRRVRFRYGLGISLYHTTEDESIISKDPKIKCELDTYHFAGHLKPSSKFNYLVSSNIWLSWSIAKMRRKVIKGTPPSLSGEKKPTGLLLIKIEKFQCVIRLSRNPVSLRIIIKLGAYSISILMVYHFSVFGLVPHWQLELHQWSVCIQ